jgi:polysaccharide export outer membrane protein
MTAAGRECSRMGAERLRAASLDAKRVRTWPLPGRDSMRLMSVRRRLAPVMFAVLALLSSFGLARAEDYVLGPEDVIAVSVWLHPELERSVTINADGNVTLPPVGELKAAGLTPKQLGDRIADRMSSYLRQTTTVTVTVAKYMSRSVFVSGSVAAPGRYGFERIPSLVEVLGAAGGALTGAQLDNVQVVRSENGARQTLAADVGAALRDGDTSRLPELRSGDMVIVTGVVLGNSSGQAPSPHEGAGVMGEVTHPGLVPVGPGAELWAVLAASGGTTPRANLRSVRVLTRTETGTSVTAYDLQAVLDYGNRSPVMIKSGDVVYVSAKRATLWSGFSAVLGLSAALLNIVIIAEYLNHR